MKIKYVTPLGRSDLIRIPSALDGRFYIGGPYEFYEILRGADEFGDKVVAQYVLNIRQLNGVSNTSAVVEVTCGKVSTRQCELRIFPTNVCYVMRYLYRESVNTEILGAIQIKITHKVHGVHHAFETSCKKVLESIFVIPSSQGKGIARVLLAVVLDDIPDVCINPQFSEDGAKLFGFDRFGKRG